MISFRHDRLRELRKDANLTQKQFSEAIGCTMASLSAYENGSKLPPTQTLINISNKFNCSIDWLMGLKEGQYIKDFPKIAIKYSSYIKELFTLNNAAISLDVGCNFGNEDTQDSYNGIVFQDPVIKLFLKSWRKTLALLHDGTIDYTIYSAWKEKVLRDFSYNIIDTFESHFKYHQAYSKALEQGYSEYDAVIRALDESTTSNQ